LSIFYQIKNNKRWGGANDFKLILKLPSQQ
jgi:hypothetical protein